MKKTNIILLLVSTLCCLSAFGTDVYNRGVKYNYSASASNNVENYGSLTLAENISVTTLIANDYKTAGWALLMLTVNGNITISNRIKTSDNVVCSKYYNESNNIYVGVCDVNENATLVDEDFNLFGGYDASTKTMTDPYHYYWIYYNLAKVSQDKDNFFRGSGLVNDPVINDATEAPIVKTMYGNELFYYYDDGKYYPVIIVMIDPSSSFSFNLNNCKTSYYAKELPKLSFENNAFEINTFTIGKSITSIASNAFEGEYVEINNVNVFQAKHINTFAVEEGNTHFCTLNNGKVLCRMLNGEPVEVIAVAYDATLNNENNKLDLPASVTKIASNALAYQAQKDTKDENGQTKTEYVWQYNINGAVWFYTPIFVEYEGPKYEGNVANAQKTNKIVHFDHPAVNYEPVAVPTTNVSTSVALSTKEPENVRGFKNAFTDESTHPITVGDLNEQLVAMSGSGLCYIDLRDCDLIEAGKNFDEINLSVVNNNCLLFLPKGATSTATNVVCWDETNQIWVCQNLSLTRTTGVPFYNPVAFKAVNASIDYAVTSNLIGLVLPFEFGSSNIITAKYTGVSNDALQLSVEETIEANTPFLAQLKKSTTGENPGAITAQNVDVPATTSFSGVVTSAGWSLEGTYRTVTNTSSMYMFGFKSGNIAQISGGNIKPFSAYFTATKEGSANVRFAGLDETTTSIESNISNDINVAVVANGINVTAINQNVLVSSVNGSVVFDKVVNGTEFISVPAGVYIVNGQKLIVNK